MRPRTLLVLSVVVAGLATFIAFIERDLPGTDERAERAKRLLALEADQVSRVAIERDGENLLFERWGALDWRLTEPVVGRADASLVDGLIAELASLEKERSFEEGEASELGLEPPRAIITWVAENGEERLLVGSDVPASEAMIVASEAAGPFHVVNRSPWESLARSVDDWRVRTVFPGGRDDITGVTLTQGDQRLVLVSHEGDFHIEAPLEDRADEGTMARFFEALIELEAEAFVDEVASDEVYGFDAAAPRLEVMLSESDEPWRLTLGSLLPEGSEDSGGSEAGGAYARADGQTYVVADVLGDIFARPAQEWRSLEWVSRQVHEIESLEIEDELGTLTLKRDGGNWLRDGVETDYAAVSDLLYAVVGTKAEALDAGEAIRGPALVRLNINAGEQGLELEVFPALGDRYPATASDRTTPVWLGGDRVRSLLSNVAAARAVEAGEGRVESESALPSTGSSAGSK